MILHPAFTLPSPCLHLAFTSAEYQHCRGPGSRRAAARGIGRLAAVSDAVCCPWCGSAFPVRQSGGRARRFCRPSCRRKFHAAVRRWGLDAIVSGALDHSRHPNQPSNNARVATVQEEQADRVGRRSVYLSLKVLPNVARDLSRLGWLSGSQRLDDAVADAVAELVERAIALGLRPS